MKKRILKVRNYRRYKRETVLVTTVFVTLLLVAGFVLIRMNSYHYSTKDDNYIAVVDEKGSIYFNTDDIHAQILFLICQSPCFLRYMNQFNIVADIFNQPPSILSILFHSPQ